MLQLCFGRFIRCFPAQYFAGIIVEPVYSLLDLLLRHFCKICSLREKPSQQAVVIFIGPFFPR